jgi:hypothetical protein
VLATYQLRVNKRTLWIAQRVYQLPTIFSVDIGQGKENLLDGNGRPRSRRGECFSIAKWLAAAILGSCLALAVEANWKIAAIVYAIFIGFAGWHVYHLLKLVSRSTWWVLFFETGRQTPVLATTDRSAVEELRNIIASAMENPPDREVVHQIHARNLVMGDHIEATGNGFVIGKQVNANG